MEYTQVTKNVIDAIKGDINSVNKWQTAGESVRGFFGTESAIVEVKAQFIADAIIPALNPVHAKALAKDLPRKGSADYVAFVGSHGADFWEDLNQMKKDARSVAHTMFARVVKYAFPAEKTETVPRDLKTRLNEELAALVKACQKAEDAPFNLNQVIVALNATLILVNEK